MLDQGFPIRVQPLKRLLFGKIFAENCMKIVSNWTESGHASLMPPRSASVLDMNVIETFDLHYFYTLLFVLK